MIADEIVNIVSHEYDSDDIAYVLQQLYNEYAGRVEFANSMGFNRDGDEVGKKVLDEGDWFRVVLNNAL